MIPNHVRQKLRAGTPSVGSWLNLGSPISAEAKAAIGYEIEHVDAVRKIDDLLSVPGLDACYTGPNDLCASFGLAPSTEPADVEFEAMMQALLASARRHGVIPGIHCATPAYANRRIAERWRLVGITNDLRFVTAGAQASRGAIKV